MAYLGTKTTRRYAGDICKKDCSADSGIVLGKVSFSNDGSAFYYSFAKHWFNNEGAGTKELTFDGKSWQKPNIIAGRPDKPCSFFR